MNNDCTRRQWLAAAAGAALTRPFAPAASAAASSMGPTPRVAIAKCPTYGAELLPAMQRMFDQLGGLERLVKGKTVAILRPGRHRGAAAGDRSRAGLQVPLALPAGHRGMRARDPATA